MLTPEEKIEALVLAQTYGGDSSTHGKMSFFIEQLLEELRFDPEGGSASKLLEDWTDLERLIGGLMGGGPIGDQYYQLVGDALVAVRRDVIYTEKIFRQIEAMLERIERKMQNLERTSGLLQQVNQEYILLLEGLLEGMRSES